MNVRLLLYLLLAPLLGLSASPTITGLGDIPGGSFYSVGYDITPTGEHVVGLSKDSSDFIGQYEAFIWSSSTGMTGLGFLPGGTYTWSEAYGVSADGAAIAGWSRGASGVEAFLWTENEGLIPLGDLAGGDFYSRGYGISDDGYTIVGYSRSEFGEEAFSWTEATGMVGLGDIDGGDYLSRAFAVSSDGSVVVGFGKSSNGQEAFRWTSVTGMVGLGDLAGGDYISSAEDVSSEGSAVVGFGAGPNGQEAFRWTSETGMVGLGDLDGGISESRAKSVSADGTLVVGYGNSTQGQEAFIWDTQNGMRRLADVAGSAGLDLGGWSLKSANAVNSDGSKVVGYGLNPLGKTEAFLIEGLPVVSIPAVSSVYPNPIPLMDGNQLFTVYGSNFDPDCTVTLRDHRTGEIFPDRTKVSQSDTSIELSVNFTDAAAVWSVEVINPGDVSSGEFFFEVGERYILDDYSSSVNLDSGNYTPYVVYGAEEDSAANVTISGGELVISSGYVRTLALIWNNGEHLSDSGDTVEIKITDMYPYGAAAGIYIDPEQLGSSEGTEIRYYQDMDTGSFVFKGPWGNHDLELLNDPPVSMPLNVRIQVLSESQGVMALQTSLSGDDFPTIVKDFNVNASKLHFGPVAYSAVNYSANFDDLTFITNPETQVPSISSVDPDPAPLINGKQPFTIFGFNFDPDCTVTLRDHRTGEVFPDRNKISQTDTLIELSVNFTAAPAEWSVEVTNQGGISSNRYYFRVGDPVVAGETRLEITPIPDAPVGEYSSSSVTIEGGTDISFEIKLVNDSGENDVTGAADLFASNLDGMNLNNFRLYTDEGLDTAETTISAYYDSSDGRVASDPILVSVLPQLTVTVNYEWLPDRGEHKLSAEVYDPAGLVDESDCSFNWDLGADGVVEYEGFGSVIYPGSVFYDHALSMGTNRILVRAETEENPKRVDYDEITVILESKHSQEPVSQSAYEPSVGDILDDEGFDAVLTSEKADVGLIVLIHGMDDTGESEWIQGLYAEIYEAIDPVPNIVIYDWHEMSDADYVKINLPDGELLEIYDRDEAFGIVDDILEVRKAGLGQGYLLASKIDKLIDSGLVQTDKPIHLIGHSAGGFVAGKVAEELVLMYLSGNLSDPGIQITMLDTPCPLKKHLVEASSFVTPERYISSRFGKARLWLGDDNTYYRKEIPKRYGNGLLFDQIKNHGYAHEWYRETVKRTESLFHSEGDGFQRSLFFGSQALTTQTEENSTIIEPSSATLQTSSNNMTEISGFSKFGDVFTSPPDFTITEEVNAGIYTDYTMPIGAEYLHFSTQYSGKNDGDFLSVHFGDEVVAVIPDVEYRRGSLFKNKINVGHLAGETNTLMFKLVSRGDPGCSLLLSNIGITKTEDPDADGLTILEEESVGSDPLDPDSDNDGLSDGDEVNTYGTDPLKADTDDDGQNDGDEIRAGTDPLAAEDALRITNFEMLPDGSVDLTWSSKSDKTYRVYRTETLDFLNYRAVGGGAIPGEAGTTNLTDTPAVDVKKMFYWIEVEDF